MKDERERCAGPGCRIKLDQENQWARDGHGRYCSIRCYLRRLKINDPARYRTLVPYYGEVD